MAKKILSILVVISVIFAFASCGKKLPKIEESTKKIALIVPEAKQYPEFANYAKAMESKYSGNIIVKEYADSRILTVGNPGIVSAAKEAAADKEIGAIIFAPATQFAKEAAISAKATNPNLVVVALEPENDIISLAGKVNLVMYSNGLSYAQELVECAANKGAEYFVFYSFNRHATDNAVYVSLKDKVMKQCEEKGITFLYENSVDPIFTNGFESSKAYISQSLSSLYNSKKISGENIAVYSTDSSVQSTLVNEANSRGLIYISPSFPTAYNGLCEGYDVKLPEDITDIDSFVKSVKSTVKSDKNGSGRFFIYTKPFMQKLMEGGILAATKLINEENINGGIRDEIVFDIFPSIANNKFTIEKSETIPNTYKCYWPGFEAVN